MPHIVLAGYLGCGNLGDDAVMLGIVERLGPECEFTVLSGDPDETHRQYSLQSVPRKNFGQVELAMKRADAVIFPGGSVFQDSTSVKSVLYYAHIAKLAKKHSNKLIFLGQGVGPLKSFFGKRQSTAAFNSADLICVRDPGSMATLRDLGVKVKVHQAADSAFLLSPPLQEEGSTYNVGGMKSIAIAPRPIHKKGNDDVVLMGEFCRMAYQAGYAPTLIEMDPAEDGPLIDAISKQQGGRIPQLRKLGSPMMVQQRLARMDSVVAVRLHAGILAASVGVPPLMVSYDPKVSAFSQQIGVGPALPIEGLTPSRLFDAFQNHLKERERLAVVVRQKLAEQQSSAMKNILLAREILGLSV